MAKRPKLKWGNWLVTTDCCGRVRHNTQVKRGVSEVQAGLIICIDHWEPLHRLTTHPPGRNVKSEKRPKWPVTEKPRHTNRVRDDSGNWIMDGVTEPVTGGTTYTPPAP